MPILISMDVSLSMGAPLDKINRMSSNSLIVSNESSAITRKTAAITGVASFLEFLKANNRQEYVGLSQFSRDVEFQEFTKDYSSLLETVLDSGDSSSTSSNPYDARVKLNDSTVKSTLFDLRTKTNVVAAFKKTLERCIAVWGSNILCNLVFITDCDGYNPEFEKLVNYLSTIDNSDGLNSDQTADRSPLSREFFELIRRGNFSCHVVCVNNSSYRILQQTVKNYKKFIDLFPNGGSFRFIDENIIDGNRISTFENLADELSASSSAILHCGSFASSIDIVPALKSIRKETDFGISTTKCSETLTILGFMKPVELGSPPITSRHLLLPSKKSQNVENADPVKQKPMDDEKTPNFCVLLHGAMKLEDMAAICEIEPNWYGYIYHLPNAKRSSLVLHCLEPGLDAIPWLGPLNKLVLRQFTGAPVAKSQLPTIFKTKPSYAVTSPNWIHQYGLQSDFQKVLRYARKLPDKEIQFYQELDRVCNEAVSLGFTELFLTLAQCFEREMQNAPKTPQANILKNISVILASGRVRYGEFKWPK